MFPLQLFSNTSKYSELLTAFVKGKDTCMPHLSLLPQSAQICSF